MAQFELNLRDYWQIIRKRQMVLLIIFFAVLMSAVVYTGLQQPVYRAIASVQWIERKTLGSLLTEMVTVRAGDPLVAQSRIITSLPVLEAVVKEMGLVDSDAGLEKITQKARELQPLVTTEVIADTNIIHIIVNHKNREVVALIANYIAKAYIDENLKEKTKQSRSVREFVEGQLEEVSNKLRICEDKLAEFKETELPSGVALSMQNRLSDLQRRRGELLELYTQNHPDIINIDEQIKKASEELKIMPKQELEYSRLTRDVEINSKLYRELKDKLEAARIAEAEKVEDVALVEPAMPAGEPISPNKPLNYLLGVIMGLMLGLGGAFIFEQLDTSIGTIEDVENYLKIPVLGVIPYLKTANEKRMGFLQELWFRKFGKKNNKSVHSIDRLVVNFSNSSPVFESYRILRTNIQTEVFKEKIKGKVLLFSSSGPEEGKSLTTANLAITMAQGGLRTLLIDADLRRPTIHKIFGLKDREPGLSDILRGTVSRKESIRTLTDVIMGSLGVDITIKTPGLDNLNIITSGSNVNSSAELLYSDEMKALLEQLRAEFDLVLIDSPPVLAVADATIIAPHTDGVVLVYRVGQTARSILSRTKTQLVESGMQVRGVILNNISADIEMRYGYYYHYKYYGKYYNEKKEVR
jgi:tyrosine-protein kinase Etk/Wzc